MKRFLFANPFGLGDVIFTLACAEKIRRIYPDAFIGFIGNERTEPLLRVCSSVDCVYVFNRDHLRSCLKISPFLFFKQIRSLMDSIGSKKYQTLIDFSLGREFSFAAAWLGIGRRIGFDYKGRGLFLNYKQPMTGYRNNPVAAHQLALLRDAGIFADDLMPEKISIHVPAFDFAFKANGPVIAFAPGGGRSWGSNAYYKQWDPKLFTEAANKILKDMPAAQIALIGDKTEEALLKDVGRGIQAPVDHILAGEPLDRVCAFLRRTEILVGNDGGLMHLANALGTKTVSIFGPVDERVYGPFGGDAKKISVTEPVPCRPCYQNFHFPRCGYSRRCLTQISVEKVAGAIKEIA